MNKVAIYLRLSQEDKDKLDPSEYSRSIQNQKLMLTNITSKNDWLIYDIYSDDDYAGSDRNRPEFKRLLEDAEKKKFSIILCKSQSRFTRELELVEKYLHNLFPIWGIRFIGVVDNADTDIKGNKKSRQINGLVNEWYLEDMSENIRSVFKAKAESGTHIGSFVCFGYLKDLNKKGKIFIDEKAAEIVRLIFDLYEKGNGQIKICKYLNERSIPSPSYYKKLCGLNYKAGTKGNPTTWNVCTIKIILTNQMYIGSLVQHTKENISYKSNKQRKIPKEEWIIIKNNHEAIITDEQFNRVQLLLASKNRAGKSGKRHKYSGKLRCLNCDSAMFTNTWKNTRYFRCRNKVEHRGCIGSKIKEITLDRYILNEFRILCDNYLNTDFVEARIESERKSIEAVDNIKKEIVKIDGNIEKFKKSIKQFYFDKVEGIISKEEYLMYSDEFQDKIKLSENRKDELCTYLSTLENGKINNTSKSEIIESYINTQSLTREMIDKLIHKIEIGLEDEKNNKIPIRIHWNI